MLVVVFIGIYDELIFKYAEPVLIVSFLILSQKLNFVPAVVRRAAGVSVVTVLK